MIIYFALICFFIALISLYLAYFKYSSPAYQIEFAYAFKGKLSENDKESLKERTQVGFIIESARIILALFTFILMVIWKYKIKSYNDIINLISVNKVYWIAVLLILICSSVTLFWYHFYKAPVRLANNSKYWKILKTKKFLWTNCSKYWERIFNNPTKRKNITNPKTKEYFYMFKRPYRIYLLYSFIIFVCILIPILSIAVNNARTDYEVFTTFSHDLKNDITYANSYNEFTILIDHFSQAPNLINPTLSRFIWLVFFFSLTALFEVLIGYRTLANLAIIFTIIGYLSVFSCTAVILPNLFSYEDVFEQAKIKSTIIYSGIDLDSESKQNLKHKIEELNEYSINNIIFSKGNLSTGFAFIIGMFNLGIAVKKIFGSS
ncbi:MAG: hypothetical protein KAT66_07085 [Candidatus Lokiarchaeota archaeon]|nr:hypothetical protein [Candidatus Lokiarchaeota archaeon]